MHPFSICLNLLKISILLYAHNDSVYNETIVGGIFLLGRMKCQTAEGSEMKQFKKLLVLLLVLCLSVLPVMVAAEEGGEGGAPASMAATAVS